jgi:hypothetical protein
MKISKLLANALWNYKGKWFHEYSASASCHRYLHLIDIRGDSHIVAAIYTVSNAVVGRCDFQDSGERIISLSDAVMADFLGMDILDEGEEHYNLLLALIAERYLLR